MIFSWLPVEGPRFAMATQLTTPMRGIFFRSFTDYLESSAMLHGGAFPSAHCAAATVMLLLSYKYSKRLFYSVVVIIVTLYISTMYGRFHYPLDVVGGFIAGVFGIKLYLPVKRYWQRLTDQW